MSSVISLGSLSEEEGAYICPLSKSLLKDPVQIHPCNHIVSRESLEKLSVIHCPLCSKKMIGYGRSIELECRIDAFVRKKMKISDPPPFPTDYMDSLIYLTNVYGIDGVHVFSSRNQPYRFMSEHRQHKVLAGIRALVSKVFVFLVFTGIIYFIFWYYQTSCFKLTHPWVR
ncbi:MAG: hypothetical protein HY860_04480 [Chlamydiales bacterium]|nr:hypothetical protein [Chlamydiales bacterium]